MTSSTENEETMEPLHAPKTPHEEIMFVVESTNDIVSAMSENMKCLLSIQENLLKIISKKWGK